MEERKRKRIPMKTGVVSSSTGTVIIDEKAYVKNLGTDHGRMINSSTITIKYDKWIDKHYNQRVTTGDDNGDKREGIEPEVVESIINEVFAYLFFFSAAIRGFVFIASKVDKNRAIINKINGDKVVNVVLEIHYFDKNHFEITIKTADCRPDFRIAEGQYFIEINDGFHSLKQIKNGKKEEILTI